MTATIERDMPSDAPEIMALLRRNQLPLDGLLNHLATTLVARQGGRIVGSATLETYIDGALCGDSSGCSRNC